jgi:archaellum component FlaC
MEEQRKLRVQTYQEREIKLRQTELELAEHLNMYQEKEGIFAKSIDDMSSISDQFLERVSSMEAELAKYQLEIEGSRDMLKSKNEKLERFQSHILALESKILEEVSDDSLETTSKSLQQRRAELVRELRDLQPPPPPPPPLPPAAAVPVSSEDPDVIAKSSSRRILGMSGLSTSSSSAAEEDSFPSPRNSCPPSSSSRTSREGGFGGMETVVGAETPISSPKPTMNSKRIGDEQYSPEEY